jgi:Mlc titration factor MtfA (ptsG expression regulator)
MPFDTTYYIPAGGNRTDIKYTVTGGDSVVIYLNNGELPPHLDPGIEKYITSNFTPPEKKETHYVPGTAMVFIFIAVFIFILVKVKREAEEESMENEADDYMRGLTRQNNLARTPTCLTYYGSELSFSRIELTTILFKRFPYYNTLSPIQKEQFLKRLRHFIGDKTFKIHDKTGYKEMPVLISAAAIQLTFGLEQYLLPNFEFIHVYPQEFMRIQETICFLEGNVSGHSINLSWKHFLEGYATPDDGQNVGLHELAHALYYQTFIVEENVDKGFRNFYDGFVSHGNKAFLTEKTVEGGLYSEYAVKNFQEFWAETVEIFFEKPAAMKSSYPELYDTIKLLLNQDPYNKISRASTS